MGVSFLRPPNSLVFRSHKKGGYRPKNDEPPKFGSLRLDQYSVRNPQNAHGPTMFSQVVCELCFGGFPKWSSHVYRTLFNQPPTRRSKESTDPLMLCVSAPDTSYEEAKPGHPGSCNPREGVWSEFAEQMASIWLRSSFDFGLFRLSYCFLLFFFKGTQQESHKFGESPKTYTHTHTHLAFVHRSP